VGVARGEALERHQRPDIALGRPDTNQSRSWPAQPVARGLATEIFAEKKLLQWCNHSPCARIDVGLQALWGVPRTEQPKAHRPPALLITVTVNWQDQK
jgi:hypothetical protein